MDLTYGENYFAWHNAVDEVNPSARYAIILVTTPATTVRPPSRIAKLV